MKGPRKQNRIDILDWTLEIKEVSLILNWTLKKYHIWKQNHHVTPERKVSTNTVHKSNNSLGTTNTLSII